MQELQSLEKVSAKSERLAKELNEAVEANNNQLLFPEGGNFSGRFRAFDHHVDSLHFTRAESNHDATVVIWEDESTNEVIPLFIKQVNLDGLHREISLNTAVHERITKLETFEIILAITTADRKHAYFATRMMHDLVPLSEIEVQDIGRAEALMRRGMEILKEMQQNGIEHKDPFPKNLGIRTSQPGLLGVVYDFEYGRVLNIPVSESVAYRQCSSMLDKLKSDIHESSQRKISLHSLEILIERILKEYFPSEMY